MTRLQVLKKNVKSSEPRSSGRIMALNDLFFETINVDVTEAAALADQAYTLTSELADPLGEVYHIRNTAMLEYFNQKMVGAKQKFQQALETFETLNHPVGQGECHFFLGLIYWENGDQTRGYESVSRALSLARSAEDRHGEAWALTMLGGFCYDEENYCQSLTYCRQANRIFHHLQSDEGLVRSLNCIGNNYHCLGEPDKALKYQYMALQIFKRYHNQQAESRILNEIGKIYHTLGKHGKALNYINDSIRVRREIGHTVGLVSSLLDLGDLYNTMQAYIPARDALLEALALAKQLCSHPKTARAHKALANVYANMEEFASAYEHHQEFHQFERAVCRTTAENRFKYLQAMHEQETAQREMEIYRLKNIALREKNDQLESLLSELNDTQSQLVNAEKMAVLGQVAAGMCHELNTPLGVLKSATDVGERSLNRLKEALEDLDAGSNKKQLQKTLAALGNSIELNKTASKRIHGIGESLKHFAALDASAFKVTNLHHSLDSVIDFFKHEYEERITIQKNYGEIPEIGCYAGEINQVFMHIILNAAQAISGEGRIEISTRSEEDEVIISVRDNGCGIPAKKLSQLFTPDFSSKGNRIKAGLGLCTSSHIVEKHSGRITVESKVGKGSTFKIILPVRAKITRQSA